MIKWNMMKKVPSCIVGYVEYILCLQEILCIVKFVAQTCFKKKKNEITIELSTSYVIG